MPCVLYNLLARKQITTVSDLEGWTGEKMIEKIDFFGPVRLKELEAALADIGLQLPFTVPAEDRILPRPVKASTRVHPTEVPRGKVLPVGTKAVLNNGSLHTLEQEATKGEKVFVIEKMCLGRVMGYLDREKPSWYFRSFGPYGLALKDGEWVWLTWEAIIKNGYGWFHRL